MEVPAALGHRAERRLGQASAASSQSRLPGYRGCPPSCGAAGTGAGRAESPGLVARWQGAHAGTDVAGLPGNERLPRVPADPEVTRCIGVQYIS
ncbi:hypothetical protein GCM10017567_73750 [Amycolatopsis bullii]|uniref:Uncharacterized protein n=1 Tax=Amycolatopsis bullii TaxID=941987 RepID=A0ABQ3KNZ7_9PSEU|nr:hypothetical protein GCM10017567_73750 [Amycolatopsis bullii]